MSFSGGPYAGFPPRVSFFARCNRYAHGASATAANTCSPARGAYARSSGTCTELPTGLQGKSNKNNPAALVAHEQDLRDATDQLLIKVQEFRAQLDGTHTADVFSVGMYKQTKEIEHLRNF